MRGNSAPFRARLRTILGCLLAIAVLLAGCTPGGGPAQSAKVGRKSLTIALDDSWTAGAELTYPAEGEGPWPTVILFHGSGVVDMDSTNIDYATGKVVSANFKLLGERLGEAGYAVLRFHKRGVKRLGQYDKEQALKATTNQLIADAAQVIAAARALPEVDDEQLYLYGWSQGAQVAAHAALADPSVAGVILQGPPTSGWSEILHYQHLTLGLPLLRQVDQDGDGNLSVKEWMGVPAGPASLMGSFYVWALDSTPQKPKLRPETDRNGDELVDLDGELRPAIEAYLANPAVNPMMNPASEPSEQIAEIMPAIGRPVLVLHGEADGWVPVEDGAAVAAAAPDSAALRRFPGLGHALSPTEDPARDQFGVMADEPIAALIEWLDAQRDR